MVVQDESGFVPLLYRQPIPFARAWFGLAKLRDYLGQHVVATGWYRRSPGPVIEVREVRAAAGQTARTWWYPIAYGLSAVVLAAGIIITLAGIAGA